MERPSLARALEKRRLRALPPSMRTIANRTVPMMVSSMSRKHPVYGIFVHWSALLKLMGCSD